MVTNGSLPVPEAYQRYAIMSPGVAKLVTPKKCLLLPILQVVELSHVEGRWPKVGARAIAFSEKEQTEALNAEWIFHQEKSTSVDLERP